MKKQNEIGCLEREIESLIWEAVRERQGSETSSAEKDLLQTILEGAINDQSLGKGSSKRFIVDNCKSIYFAGHESTAVAASWCMMLLALHPEWQARIRTELAQVCPDGLPDANSLPQLKTVQVLASICMFIIILLDVGYFSDAKLCCHCTFEQNYFIKTNDI